MNILESIRIALEGLAANRLRSALTMLGVIFGVGAVIAAVSMTEGAKAATMAEFERFGTNLLTVRPGQLSTRGMRHGVGSAQTLTLSDAEAILRECSTAVAIAPEVSSSVQVKGGSSNTNTRTIGTSESYPSVRQFDMAEGVFFSKEDVTNRRKVAVLGPTTVENLFGKEHSGVGRRIKINGVTFNVIGQFVSKGDTGFWSPDDQIIVPITTAIFRLGIGRREPGSPRDAVNSVTVQFRDIALAEQARTEVETVLNKRHNIGRGEESDFFVSSAADLIEGAEEANRIMTLLFGAIAAVSLLVGGIGIMNILLVSVTERTREIGLRKAVGATPRDILLQFLIESVTLSVLGGIIGVGLGVGLAHVLRGAGLNIAVSVPWVVVSFCFAAMVGIVFGILPSRKAAMLDPIEALRYE